MPNRMGPTEGTFSDPEAWREVELRIQNDLDYILFYLNALVALTEKESGKVRYSEDVRANLKRASDIMSEAYEDIMEETGKQ